MHHWGGGPRCLFLGNFPPNSPPPWSTPPPPSALLTVDRHKGAAIAAYGICTVLFIARYRGEERGKGGEEEAEYAPGGESGGESCLKRDNEDLPPSGAYRYSTKSRNGL